MKNTSILATACATIFSLGMGAASAADCPAISHTDLTSALTRSVKASGGATNGGLDFNMWATVVSIDGTVCAIAKSGTLLNDQWLGSRSISAQKASTAIFFSTPDFALSSISVPIERSNA